MRKRGTRYTGGPKPKSPNEFLTARAALKLALWRLARDHGLRPRAACDRWRREDRKIGVAASEAIEANLAIPHG